MMPLLRAADHDFPMVTPITAGRRGGEGEQRARSPAVAVAVCAVPAEMIAFLLWTTNKDLENESLRRAAYSRSGPS